MTYGISGIIPVSVVLILCMVVVLRRQPEIILSILCAVSYLDAIHFWGTSMQMVLSAVALASCATYLAEKRFIQRERTRDPILPLFIVYSAWVLGGILISQSFDYGRWLAILYFLKAGIPFLVFVVLVGDEMRLRRFVLVYVLFSVLSGGFVVAQFWERYALNVLLLDIFFRLGVYGDAITFSIPFGIAALFAIYLLQESSSRTRKVLLVFAFAFVLVIILLTRTRQTLLSTVIVGAYLVVVLNPLDRRRLLVWTTVPLLGLGGLFSRTQVLGRLGEFFASPLRIGGTVGRFHSWSSSLSLAAAKPLAGWGLGGVGELHAHNLFLDVAVQLGGIGLVLFVSLIGLSAHMGWKAIKFSRTPHHQRLAILALATLAYGVLQGQFSGGIVGSSHVIWATGMILAIWQVCRVPLGDSYEPVSQTPGSPRNMSSIVIQRFQK